MFLFVYGTLLQAAQHPMHRLLNQHAAFVGIGHIHADLYDLGFYPGIVLAGNGDGTVVGEVYALHADTAAETWRALDEYEGCSDTTPEPHQYRRERVCVRLAHGEEVAAWVYALGSVPKDANHVTSGDYLVWRRGQLDA